MGRQCWTGGRTGAAQLFAEIKGQDRRWPTGMKLWAPLVQGDRFGEAGPNRIGRLAVIEQLNAGLPEVVPGERLD